MLPDQFSLGRYYFIRTDDREVNHSIAAQWFYRSGFKPAIATAIAGPIYSMEQSGGKKLEITFLYFIPSIKEDNDGSRSYQRHDPIYN